MIPTQESKAVSAEYDKKKLDLFSRPPAGYSLTQEPNKWPWDRPPQYTKIEDAYKSIRTKMLEPSAWYDILNLLDAGISVETIIRSVTFGAFTQGIVNPDLAELLLPPLCIMLTLEASKAGISPTVRSNITKTTIPEENILEIMKELRPERYYELKNKGPQNSVGQVTKEETLSETKESFLSLINKEDK